MIIPLNPPFQYEDYNLPEIDLDLAGKMTPRMHERCEAEFRRLTRGDMVPVPYLDSRYRLIVASKVTGLPKEILLELPFEAYNVMHNTITYFFTNSQEPSMEMDTDTDTEPENPKPENPEA